MIRSLTIPVTSPSKAGVQDADVQSFARDLERRFHGIVGTVRQESGRLVGGEGAAGMASGEADWAPRANTPQPRLP